MKIRSLSPDEHGCTAKVSEANGTPMEVMGVAFYKAAKKRCKKLKVGQKVKLTPREIMYLFMKEVPQNGKRNIGMLAVFPY
ncbi:MAG TPA: hypothetical protein PLY93_11755 [Turneriella sp.]|nr:hypothetical protein [Turneriella sp.]